MHRAIFDTKIASHVGNPDFFSKFASKIKMLPAVKIADIEFARQPLFLAPMEDVTDPAFRLLCKRFGADLVYTEFVSADALIRSVKRTEQKLTILPEERPVAIQIYGRDIPTMVEAAKIVEQACPDILDLNFGCPVKKVAGKGAGSGMLRDIPKLLAITREVVKAVNIPVTVKTRLGWDDNSKIIVDLAEALQDCGIQALAIHGRTRAQMYTGDADWTLIGAVKNNPRMHIPIIGNGDVTTPQRARECFDRYGVDAVMIGRGAIGRPDFRGDKAFSGHRRHLAGQIVRFSGRHHQRAHRAQHRVAGRRAARHCAQSPPLGLDTAIQRHRPLSPNAHRHVACRNQSGTLCHHRRHSQPICNRIM